LALSRHFENLRYLLTLYDSLTTDSTTAVPGKVYEFSSNTTNNKILSLMYTDTSAIEISNLFNLKS